MNHAHDKRPAEYDAALLKHIRLIQRMAYKYDRHNREEFVQDLHAYLLDKWHYYKPVHPFSTWVRMSALSVHCSRYKAKTALCRNAPMVYVDADASASILHSSDTPESAIDLASVVARLRLSRGGEMLLRRAMGDGLREIAEDHGISKERARQILIAERDKLKAAA